jgi:hypothetical protein
MSGAAGKEKEMTAREVKDVAKGWIRENAAPRPGFAGAHLGGSICRMGDEDPFPDTSDVDLHVIIDGPVPDPFTDVSSDMRQQKIISRGIVLEVVYDSLSAITAENVLRSPLAAPAFTASCVLFDPTGQLARVQEMVTADFARENWVRERCLKMAELMRLSFDWSVSPPPLQGWETELLLPVNSFFLFGIPCLACIPLVANLGGWTCRKCLVRVKEVLGARGRNDLYDSILDLAGCRTLGASRVKEHCRELSATYDEACRVIRTAFYPDFEIQPAVRAITLGGCTDLLENGFHREVVPFLFFVRSSAQNALWNDGSGEQKKSSMSRYLALLGDVGIERGIFEEKRRRGVALSEELLAVSEQIIRTNPLIRR